MKLNKKLTLSTTLTLCSLPLVATSCGTISSVNNCVDTQPNSMNDIYDIDVAMIKHTTHHCRYDKDGASDADACAFRMLNDGNKWGAPALKKQNDGTFVYTISHGQVDHTLEAAYTKFAISANLPAGKKMKLNFEIKADASFDWCLTGSVEDWNQEIWNFDTDGAAYPTNYFVGRYNSYPFKKDQKLREDHFNQLKSTNSWYVEHTWEDKSMGSHSANWLDKGSIEFKTQKEGYNTWYFAYFVGEEQEWEKMFGDNHLSINLTLTPTIQ